MGKKKSGRVTLEVRKLCRVCVADTKKEEVGRVLRKSGASHLRRKWGKEEERKRGNWPYFLGSRKRGNWRN